jgi:succinyl-diaminopimelate desuccinylase
MGMRELVDLNAVVELASELVSVDTSNPPGNEAAIEGVIRDALAGWNPRWTEVLPSPGRLSLIAALPADPRRKTLIVNGHLDVVPAEAGAWSHKPFDPCVESGRLFGRGSADMKGGIAAAICALEVLDRSGRDANCNLVFHFVADEERGGKLGTRVLLDRGLIQGDACLVPEPTGLDLCVAERGLLQAHVLIEGRPGHGSRPREGVSAIEHAARVVLALHGADFGDAEHPLLGRPTANVGTIAGGSTLNTVAESCQIGLDRRVLPGTSQSDAVAAVRQQIETAGVDGLRYELVVDDFGEGSEMSPDEPFVSQLRAAVERGSGRRPEVIGMSFTTDARFVRNQAGIPAVVCGPGSVSQAHGHDEWVSLEELAAATAAFAELYASFG